MDHKGAHQLQTEVFYLIKDPKFDTEKPFFSNIPFDHPEAKQTNLESAPEPVTITSIRGHEKFFQLESHGFEVFNTGLDVDYSRFADNNWIQEEYYPVVESWLKKSIGESRIKQVYVYQHTANHTHGSGPIRVRAHLPEHEAVQLMNSRFQIINAWQPLFGPIEDWPLALCDATSVAPADLIPTDLIYPNYYGEAYNLTVNERHRWYYLENQMPNEVLLFKCFDSCKGCNARFTPHCGFRNPEAAEHSRPRESIEFRAMVFYEST